MKLPRRHLLCGHSHYREVQLDLTPEIEVFHVRFERCLLLQYKEIYQTAYKILQFLVKFSWTTLGSMHSLCDGDGDVVDGEPPLEEEVLSHVGQRRRGVDRVPTHTIPLQVRRRVATLFYKYSGRRLE